MTLQQLYYAITVAEAGSMNKASELLYISQPSLTNAMKELEKEIGISIFNRSGRGVTLTNDGAEFLLYAKELYAQYTAIMEKYGAAGDRKKKFGVSSQHYSFAVKAFVEMVQSMDPSEYELAMRETKTREVISDVATLRSEIGILYLSDFNRKALQKLLNANELVFHRLIECRAYVYLWRGHPLASCREITFRQLSSYPCLSFEQGDNGSLYYSEEVFSEYEYPQIIKANDRATVLNLMVGLNGYTICSGIICEELNGSDYIAVPLACEGTDQNGVMEIGYITRKNMILSRVGRLYIEKISEYLGIQSQIPGITP